MGYVVGVLWFIPIAFMFFAQHHVCDAYFVPAINVFVDKMKNSKNKWLQRWGEEAVAGATICALGCNGPELFTNLISLYTGCDAGIGVVVGSEIFNLLIIIGATVLAAVRLPLNIDRAPFTRDVFFYALSIGLLYWAMKDTQVSFFESCVLLGAAVLYVSSVYFTSDLVGSCSKVQPGAAAIGTNTKQKGKMHGIEVEVEQMLHSRMADGKMQPAETWDMAPTDHGIYAKPNDQSAKPNARGSIGLQLGGDGMLGPVLRYEDLKEVSVMGEGVINLDFRRGFQHLTLRCTVTPKTQRDELLKRINQFSTPWVHSYDPTVKDAFHHLHHAFTSKDSTFVMKLHAIPEFIIDLCLKSTLFLVDVKHIEKEGRWPLCFLGAMCWLAVFSYAMLEIAVQINANIPQLPTSFLGITVCAVGTSFPNAVASIIMAQQDKPAAAIANALGSNVQNVFLAMALPWVIYGATHGYQPIEQNAAGINEGVAWMGGTLLLLVVFVILPGFCSLTKVYGYILLSTYLAYVTITSLETFGVMAPLVK
eukprot:TRINITY_DN988_c0_g2_i2.p1 TRINITY_DN988_c0_g2~~TRINITY_DN988_c0_g2_i2.p1  ORF type:complete len:556 (+),score=100.78 TRINITY_DN988_c0_g2_i2:67-1668(+)